MDFLESSLELSFFSTKKIMFIYSFNRVENWRTGGHLALFDGVVSNECPISKCKLR
jgi:hypothetical protein